MLIFIASCSIQVRTKEETKDENPLVILDNNNLPIVNIVIDESAEGFGTIEEMNSSPDHFVECTGTINIIVPDNYKGDYSEEILESTSSLELEYIRGRGNTTWISSKKPYKFKLSEKADLLGMGLNKHWILLANDFDETLLRNRIVSYLGSQLGLAYTPKMLPVDVVMNGEYIGSYYLSEQVRIGKSRVNIDELDKKDKDEDIITGGYLFSYANFGENGELTTSKGVSFNFRNPEFSAGEGNEKQKEYIMNYIQEAEDALYRGEGSDYIDFESMADYWWIQTFTNNVDAFITDSTYLYKPRDGKIFFGPLWDFDLSIGRSYSSIEGFNFKHCTWVDYLRENDEEFVELLNARWEKLNDILYTLLEDGGIFDEYLNEIRNLWFDNLELSSNQSSDFEFDTLILKQWIIDRQEWINNNLEYLSNVLATLSFEVNGEIISSETIYSGNKVSSFPEKPSIEGYYFLGWKFDEEYVDEESDLVFYEDTILQADFIPNSEVTHAENIYFETSDIFKGLYPYEEFNTFKIEYFVTPIDVIDNSAFWTVEDTDIASVDNEGNITLYNVGTTTVTAILFNGTTKSFTLHVYDAESVEPSYEFNIVLNEEEIHVKVGEFAQIEISTLPQPNYVSISYEFDQEDIIEFYDYFVFEALQEGTVTITFDNGDGQEVKCIVVVTE